jgi:DNA-binding HxlR family transcriptional regulator/putative sterol carrier protein
MARRTYNQFCGLARSLDIVGERWTLLIVRELMAGPKRYVDLSDGLEGIGTSLLATRLRQLEEDGVVYKRQLPKPAASLVYQLTESGEELARAMLPLALWGIRHHVGPMSPSDEFHAEWPLVFIAPLVDREKIRDTNALYEFRIAGTSAFMRFHDGEVTVSASDPAEAADVVVSTEPSVVVDLSGGRSTLLDAVADGRISVEGDPIAGAKLFEALPDRIDASAGLSLTL